MGKNLSLYIYVSLLEWYFLSRLEAWGWRGEVRELVQKGRTQVVEHLLLSRNSQLPLPTDNTAQALHFIPEGSLFFCLNIHLLADSLRMWAFNSLSCQKTPLSARLRTKWLPMQPISLISFPKDISYIFTGKGVCIPRNKIYKNRMTVGRWVRGREMMIW